MMVSSDDGNRQANSNISGSGQHYRSTTTTTTHYDQEEDGEGYCWAPVSTSSDLFDAIRENDIMSGIVATVKAAVRPPNNGPGDESNECQLLSELNPAANATTGFSLPPQVGLPSFDDDESVPETASTNSSTKTGSSSSSFVFGSSTATTATINNNSICDTANPGLIRNTSSNKTKRKRTYNGAAQADEDEHATTLAAMTNRHVTGVATATTTNLCGNGLPLSQKERDVLYAAEEIRILKSSFLRQQPVAVHVQEVAFAVGYRNPDTKAFKDFVRNLDGKGMMKYFDGNKKLVLVTASGISVIGGRRRRSRTSPRQR